MQVQNQEDLFNQSQDTEMVLKSRGPKVNQYVEPGNSRLQPTVTSATNLNEGSFRLNKQLAASSSCSRTSRSYVGAGIRYLRKPNKNSSDRPVSNQNGAPINNNQSFFDTKGAIESSENTQRTLNVRVANLDVASRIGTGIGPAQPRRTRDGSGGRVHTAMLASKKSARSGSLQKSNSQ